MHSLWERCLPAMNDDAVSQAHRVIVHRGQAPLPQVLHWLCNCAVSVTPRNSALSYAPMIPPSSRVITITEERGLPSGKCSGKVEPPFSPGCWMPMNIVL